MQGLKLLSLTRMTTTSLYPVNALMLNGNGIPWRAEKRARRIATSTTSAELHAMSVAAKHLSRCRKDWWSYKTNRCHCWLCLYGGNQETPDLICNQKLNDITKHLPSYSQFGIAASML